MSGHKKYYVDVTCSSCHKTFSKSKYRVAEQNYCRSCNMLKTYKENPSILEKALEKRKSTCINIYGVDNVAKNDNVQEKMQDTMLKRYGTKQHAAHYKYNDTLFDSSWELAYYIYLKDNNIDFEYQPNFYIDYVDDYGKDRKYYPDFKVGDSYQEIKGNQFFDADGNPFNLYKNETWYNKYNIMLQNDIKILRYTDVKVYISYIDSKYGKDFLKSLKIR
jgi:hypothetical protein